MSGINTTSSRYAGRISYSVLVWMICLAIITAAGGVTYAVLKNKQATVEKEIAAINLSIAKNNLAINEYQTKINTLTNRWNLLSRLDAIGTDLYEISPRQIEPLRSFRDIEGGKATAAR